MSRDIDLDAYFARIQYGGPTDPTLETLSSLLRAHMLAIPFENLDVLLGRGIRIDLESIQRKIVEGRRGGYCFEQATLFESALVALGFAPVRHLARVTLVMPRESAPRTHMFHTVSLPEGTFVVDPGFGGGAAPMPVLVPESDMQGDVQADHWLVRDGRFWIMRARLGDRIIDEWASTFEPVNPVDYVLGNHYTSTYPESQFVNRIMMRALTPDGLVSVMNRDVRLIRNSISTHRTLATRADLRALLVEFFGFDMPEVEQMRVPSISEWS